MSDKATLFNSIIDGIIIINLKHRNDRLEESLSILYEGGVDLLKVRVLEASYNPSNGAKGCSESHYRAMVMAKEHNMKNVLILEDDFKFKFEIEEVANRIHETIKKLKKWDVIQLSWGLNGYKHRSKILKGVKYVRQLNHEIRGAWLTTAFLVNNTVYDRLIENFYESFEKQPDIRPREMCRWVVDRNWWKVQRETDWFIFVPKLIEPRDPLDSDIR